MPDRDNNLLKTRQYSHPSDTAEHVKLYYVPRQYSYLSMISNVVGEGTLADLPLRQWRVGAESRVHEIEYP
jgi:hypothetical protein